MYSSDVIPLVEGTGGRSQGQSVVRLVRYRGNTLALQKTNYKSYFGGIAVQTFKKADVGCFTERKNFVNGNEANEDDNDDDERGDGYGDDDDGYGDDDDDSENETATVAIKTATRYFARSLL